MPDDFTNFESKVKMYSLSNENTLRSGLTSCVRFAPGVLPEACGSDTGVSPDNAQETSQTDPFKVKENRSVWFLMRAAYGQEMKAKDILEGEGVEVFLPVVNKVRLVNGRRRLVRASLIPNFLFVRSTEKAMKRYVGMPKLEFLHHYYVPNKDENGCPVGEKGIKPLVIPDDQMEKFMMWHAVDDDNKMFIPDGTLVVCEGDKVKITKGKFAGLSGFVCRVKRQTRVGVNIEGLGTIVTAYVPKAFLVKEE